MTKVHSAIAAVTVVALLPISSSALSILPRQQHLRVDGSATTAGTGNGLFGKRSSGSIAGGWSTPSFRFSTFRFQSTKEKEEDLFFLADEDVVDEAATNEEEEQSWPVPASERAPASEPPALVLPDIDIIEKLDPLLNPAIAKAVPADTIRGASIGGIFLALSWSFLFSGPFSVLSPGTLVFAASVGIIAAYVSITEGAAGDFARGVGAIAFQLTGAAAGIVEGWQAEKEVGRIADALLTPPPPPDAAMAAAKVKAEEEAAKARAEEEAAEKALRARMRAEEEARAAEEARLQAEEDARWRAEEEALAQAAAAAREERARRLAEEEASRAQAEKEARLRAEEEARELAAAEEARRLEEEARELAAAEEARRLEEQAAAARQAVQLMEEQEALKEDDGESDGYEIDEEDWEASVRLAEELRGMEDGKASDEFLRMEMDDLSAEEEDALGKAAREAVRKYEAEMAAKSAPPVAEALIDGMEEENEYEGEVDYSKMTVVQLKDVLRSKGLKVSGKKAVLIERLMESS